MKRIPLVITNRILNELQVESKKGPHRIEAIHDIEIYRLAIVMPGILFKGVEGKKNHRNSRRCSRRNLDFFVEKGLWSARPARLFLQWFCLRETIKASLKIVF